GAWNDESDIIRTMRQLLQSQAGIEIPGSDLVLKALALYLLLLVPVNYLVFRLMNRLEYAWFAVPILAILGAAYAARQARLDIGFARSNSEIAMIEIPKDYDRGHLTRMVGVYNSLSSNYEVQFKTSGGIASPLKNEPYPGTDVRPRFRVSFEEGPSLADFAVLSNRMRYVRCEAMTDLGGGIRIDDNGLVINETDHEILDVVLVRNLGDQSETALVGMLGVGEGKEVDWRTEAAAVPSDLPMRVNALMEELVNQRNTPSGSTRLVGRIEASLPGIEIRPAAGQQSGQTVVLAHLSYAAPRIPEPDANLITDFRRVNRYDGESTPNEDTDSSNNDAP
ncbi:MAG: hypothetical protein AAGJ83_13780, partial [Planctomycetota bacterium]